MVTLVAGLLTKETAIAAPVLAAALGAAAETPDARRRIWKMAAISLAVVAGFVIRLVVLPVPASYGADLTRYGVKELLVRPFATLIVPLREEETQWAPVLAIGLVTLVVVALRIAAGRWDRHAPGFRIALVGAAMALAAVAPAPDFYIDANLLGSRYLYLAQAGWALVLIAAFQTASHGRKALICCWSAACLQCGSSWRGCTSTCGPRRPARAPGHRGSRDRDAQLLVVGSLRSPVDAAGLTAVREWLSRGRAPGTARPHPRRARDGRPWRMPSEVERRAVRTGLRGRRV